MYGNKAIFPHCRHQSVSRVRLLPLLCFLFSTAALWLSNACAHMPARVHEQRTYELQSCSRMMK